MREFNERRKVVLIFPQVTLIDTGFNTGVSVVYGILYVYRYNTDVKYFRASTEHQNTYYGGEEVFSATARRKITYTSVWGHKKIYLHNLCVYFLTRYLMGLT